MPKLYVKITMHSFGLVELKRFLFDLSGFNVKRREKLASAAFFDIGGHYHMTKWCGDQSHFQNDLGA